MSKIPRLIKPPKGAAMKPNCKYESPFLGKCSNPQPENQNNFEFCKKHMEDLDFLVTMLPTAQAIWQQSIEKAIKRNPASKLIVPGR